LKKASEDDGGSPEGEKFTVCRLPKNVQIQGARSLEE
jgi:hypothetical protein